MRTVDFFLCLERKKPVAHFSSLTLNLDLRLAMSKTQHRIYIFVLSAIVVITTIYLAFKGYSYYSTPLEERFYHPDHESFRPSGFLGHGLGIVGTFLILFGVVMYIIRKRSRRLAKLGRLKYWLEFHIFLCSLGPVMVLFHTAFKFGGIVSIAFWSMVAVVASGVIGRYIYNQIPRSIEGRELSLQEIRDMRTNISEVLRSTYNMSDEKLNTILAAGNTMASGEGSKSFGAMISKWFADIKTASQFKQELKSHKIAGKDVRKLTKIFRNELKINNRIGRLQLMQKLFRYWHVAHLPFALIMLVIVVLHVAVTLLFGYTWIF